MNYREKIEENREAQIKTLQELIQIKSTLEDPAFTRDGAEYPFGKGVQDAFEYTLNAGKAMGFETVNVDNYGGHIDFGHGEEIMAMVGHLDVVPESGDWSFPPYSGEVSDGYIYGRGTLDDKGPVVACLYAMKALKDAGYEPEKKIRLILGLDEETGWKGMEYYCARTEEPDCGFTPDAEFPALNGEKGIMIFDIAKKFSANQQGDKGLELRSLKGGSAANMVPDRARAVVRVQGDSAAAEYDHIKELAAGFRNETGHKVNIKGTGKSLEITSEGKSAHGSTPEKGLNAVSVIMEFLGRLNFTNDEVNDFIQFYNDHVGFYVNGEKLGCCFEDEPSGRLTVNAGIISYDRQAATLTINVRYPVTFTDEQVYDGIMPLINKYNLGIIKGKDQAPIYMEADSPMITTLMEVYRENTGDMETEAKVIGGGTYARAFKNIIAFGALFPGDDDLMHQKDERLSLDKFMTMTRIYADAIFKLTH